MPSSPNTTRPPTAPTIPATGPITLPRITITFCTQCKWNLRAAYFAQELLQTFGTSLGEVALVPGTGGTFVVELFHRPLTATAGTGGEGGLDEAGNALGPAAAQGGEVRRTVERAGEKGGEQRGEVQVQRTVLWDRKVDGGFPETKILKGRVRDLVEPDRGLGHTDRALRKDEKQKEEVQEGKKGEGMDAEGNAETNKEGRKVEGCEDCK